MFSDQDRAREWTLDIIDYADRVAGYVAGFTFEQFEHTQLVQDAVERCLERVSEAAVRLGEERLAAISPGLPLHRLRSFGNLLRHDYKRVSARIIWDTATNDLPALRTACAATLEEE